ncbi:hypothetical protein PSECIP111951_03192 [Pseudoalteromonas holothuriae]|uniref:Chalcone isomerase domain-containing protein n=1 Tax=Pseudoalteromonas holothuriae TaxID=2963714 RepID=A0A9W4R261_9GAMM|nr:MULTISPECIES: chalcone isomerase family protein [unclassified Pseudoalteromonas]CAH9063729.1 hypothetical protein PSECIP111854_03281 [Pseudoalteromonas sp. CIP111854]CAH9064679.1 hypothetical protein PSECIP111951_03192 [Pseudoalteromonas sp. CIP111951]
MNIKLLLIGFLLLAPFTKASISQKLLLSSEPVGGSPTLSYLFWDVYKATLYAPNGEFDISQPFVLKLHYLRDLKGEDIAARSIEEIKKQGFKDKQRLSMWLDKMQAIFPDVTDGTELYGERTQQGTSRFYLRDSFIGEVEDTLFTEKFFAIWLAKSTSEPNMRKALLNLK